MVFTAAEIKKARNRFNLKQAQKQVGPHIKSLDEVILVKKTKKQKFTLGENISRISKGLKAL